MKNLFKFLGIIAIVAIIGITLVSCGDKDSGNSSGGGGGGGGGGNSSSVLDGTWSKPDNTAIRFSGGNLQSTPDITLNNVNWTLQGTYTYSSPTLTINPPPVGGVVQNAVQGIAVISGIQLTISGFAATAPILDGNWTKQ